MSQTLALNMDIRVEYRTFPTADYRRWCAGNRSGLPETDRLVFRRRDKQPRYHFAETFHACELMAQGFVCWSGFYKLFSIPEQGHPRRTNSLEIRAALRQSGRPDPARLRALLPEVLDWPQPDVIAYHPDKGWKFHEIKLRNDRVRPEQLRTLALLGHFYDADVAVINYVDRLPTKAVERRRADQLRVPVSIERLDPREEVGKPPMPIEWSMKTLRKHGWQWSLE